MAVNPLGADFPRGDAEREHEGHDNGAHDGVDASRRSIRIYEVQQGWRVRLMPDGRRRSSAPPVVVIGKGGRG